jgi:hypothetical protein
MILQKIKNNKKGFVILFAVTLAAILLAVAVGIANIAQNEVRFGTLAKNTDDAFFSADTGAECALFYDKSTGSSFPIAGPAAPIGCTPTTPTFSGTANTGTYDFIMTGLGPTSSGCAKVNVSKNNTGSAVITTVTAKGYNVGDASCNSTNPIRVERSISLTYSNNNSFSPNVAAAASGATASASSTYSASFPASSAIDGDRAGNGWGAGTGGWNDASADSFPDWLEVDFAATSNISEIDVFTVQDTYGAPSTPTSDMTFTQWGIKDFQVQYWTGSAWQTVPEGSVTNNNLVWKQFTFTTVSTQKIRVNVTNALQSYSRVTEIEAY